MGSTLSIGVITLFPEMFMAISDYGVTGRAVQRGILNLRYWNPRDFTDDRHRTVDDSPYGGGPGMVMKVAPLRAAIRAAKQVTQQPQKVVFLSPQGRTLDQAGLSQLATQQRLLLVCGRYNGIDERLLQCDIDEEWSVGDYVLSGGELPAMIVIDALARGLPGVLGAPASAQNDSFARGLLGAPHYTRPQVLEGVGIPAVLLSGDHDRIACWRLKQSLGRTWVKRPELLKCLVLTDQQARLLAEFQQEYFEQRSVAPRLIKDIT